MEIPSNCKASTHDTTLKLKAQQIIPVIMEAMSTLCDEWTVLVLLWHTVVFQQCIDHS